MCGYYDRGKIVVNLNRHLSVSSFIRQEGWDEKIVILASNKVRFIRVHDNLVYDQSKIYIYLKEHCCYQYYHYTRQEYFLELLSCSCSLQPLHQFAVQPRGIDRQFRLKDRQYTTLRQIGSLKMDGYTTSILIDQFIQSCPNVSTTNCNQQKR